MFVYGTLKPGEANFQEYCASHVEKVIPAIAQGCLYHLPLGYPAMILGEGWISGFLLHFPNTKILESLDELEGYQPGRPPNENEYQRRELLIFNPNRRPLGLAWGYLMDPNLVQRLKGTFLPNGQWFGKSTDF
ncbi:MAG: gamma-glutamylcyclotransferase [Leptolyngbyaceae cyanobacterium MO_188.B28]|nr:gamma-glutamylcyclotransferase [Leptolyngbyaceae cyanobacterium MO_188.B28]